MRLIDADKEDRRKMKGEHEGERNRDERKGIS